MSIFRNYILTWWQVSILKIGVLALGIVLGSYRPDLFNAFTLQLLGILAISVIYLCYTFFLKK